MMRKAEIFRVLMILVVFNLSGLLHAQDDAVRGLTFAVGLNFSPVLFYHYEQSGLLKKNEELTLYVIDLKKENEILSKRIDELEK